MKISISPTTATFERLPRLSSPPEWSRASPLPSCRVPPVAKGCCDQPDTSSKRHCSVANCRCKGRRAEAERVRRRQFELFSPMLSGPSLGLSRDPTCYPSQGPTIGVTRDHSRFLEIPPHFMVRRPFAQISGPTESGYAAPLRWAPQNNTCGQC